MRKMAFMLLAIVAMSCGHNDKSEESKEIEKDGYFAGERSAVDEKYIFRFAGFPFEKENDFDELGINVSNARFEDSRGAAWYFLYSKIERIFCYIEDEPNMDTLSALAKYIKWLSIEKPYATDFSFLDLMVNLNQLTIENEKVLSLEPLKNINSLEILNLHYPTLFDHGYYNLMDFLRTFPNLKTLKQFQITGYPLDDTKEMDTLSQELFEATDWESISFFWTKKDERNMVLYQYSYIVKLDGDNEYHEQGDPVYD